MRIEYRETKMRGRSEQGRLQGRQCRKIAERTVQEDRREDSADRCGEDVQKAQGRLWEDAATQ